MASQRTHHRTAGSNGTLPLQKIAKDVGSYLRDGSRAVTDEAKAALAAAAEQVRDEAQRLFDQRKGKAAARMDAVGDAAERVSQALHAVKAESIADYVDAASDAIQNAARYLDEADLDDVAGDARRFARRHPGLVMSGMFLAGFLAARLAQATAETSDDDAAHAEQSHNGRAAQRVPVRRRRRRRRDDA